MASTLHSRWRMSTWILWFITSMILGNPLLALVIVLAVVYLGRAEYTGRYWNPLSYFQLQRQIADLRNTVETNPENAAAHNDLGRILALQGKYAEALPHMEKAFERSPESAETAFFYGYTLLASGKEQEALPHIREALEAKPSLRYGEPYLLTGNFYFKEGRHDDAIAWFEKFTEMNTDSVEGYYKLGRSCAEAGRKDDARKALEDAELAYRHAPRFIRRAQRPWNRKAKWFLRTTLRGDAG
ncbi:MAG: tetratricopeptide repeat protein [Deltaproteobacteria bacterium]|nr:tetratricopeptide repeat protein [Deltaproteobacteria bacterium]